MYIRVQEAQVNEEQLNAPSTRLSHIVNYVSLPKIRDHRLRECASRRALKTMVDVADREQQVTLSQCHPLLSFDAHWR